MYLVTKVFCVLLKCCSLLKHNKDDEDGFVSVSSATKTAKRGPKQSKVVVMAFVCLRFQSFVLMVS